MAVVDKNEERRKKQLILGGTAAALLTIVALAVIFLMGETSEEEAVEVKTVDLQPAGSIDNEDTWRRSVAEEEGVRQMEVEELRVQLRASQEGNAAIIEQMNDLNAQIAELRSNPPQVVREVRVSTPTPTPSYTPPSGSTGNYPVSPNSVLPAPNPTASTPVGGASSAINQFNSSAPIPTPSAPATPKTIEVIKFDNVSTSASAKAADNNRTLIPTTSFVAATLLNGADAPTGGQAQSNPLPLVLQVRNPANLPNGHRADIKNCRFLASAWGDLSSERMFARLESLSCVINGKAYEMPAKGYIIGEDGKTGMRGRLVSKKGKTLGLSFLAGVVSATGSVAQNVGSSATTIGGINTRVSGSDAVRSGIGSGVSEGASTLAEYYREQAERLFDVIEVDAGRSPEVLITSSIEFPSGIKLKSGQSIKTISRGLTDD